MTPRPLLVFVCTSLAVVAGCDSSPSEAEGAPDASGDVSIEDGRTDDASGDHPASEDVVIDEPLAEHDAGSDGAPDASDAGALLPAPPVVVSIDPKTYIESEPSVAVGPSGRVLVAWIGFLSSPVTSRIGYAFSSDGGKTFSAPQYVAAPLPGSDAGDPTVAFDAAGNAYLTFLGFPSSGPETDQHVYVTKAPANGGSFGAIAQVDADGLTDMPDVRVAADGSVCVTYAKSTTEIVLARSSDGGSTFTPHTVTANGVVGFASACTGDDPQRIAVTHVRELGSADAGDLRAEIALAASNTGGSAWQPEIAVSDPAATGPSEDRPSCVTTGTDIWAAYGVSTYPLSNVTTMQLSTGLSVVHSGDFGATIDRRVQVVASTTERYMHPRLVRDAASGNLYLAYYAGKDPDDGAASVRVSRSTDDGATWDAVVDASPAKLRLRTARSDYQWLGDYLGADVDAGFAIAYVANDTPESHIAVVMLTSY